MKIKKQNVLPANKTANVCACCVASSTELLPFVPSYNLSIEVITSSTNGEYWRLLLPGKYQMEVRYPSDYLAFSEVKEVEVTENQVTRKDFTIYMR